MNRVLASLTFGILLGRKRSLLIGLVLLVPVGLAVLFRFAPEDDPDRPLPVEWAFDLGTNFILLVLLPIVALVLGTSALGSEIEDGTSVFLLTKPIERWRIIVIKTLVAGIATAALVVPATIATGWIVMGSLTEAGIPLGLGLSAAVMSILYAAAFVALSAVTHRALIIGLCYVFVWEAFAANLFSSLRWLSIREYSEGWSRLLVSIEDLFPDFPVELQAQIAQDIYDPAMSSSSAVVGSVIVLAAGLTIGTRSLRSHEIGEVA